MRKGYKETAVGWIPEEWEVVQQGDVATFYNGRAYSLSEWEDSGTPVIRLQNLTGRGDDYYYSNLQLPEHQYCYKGDLLYMWSASFGAYIWQGEKAIFHYHIWKIECNDEALDKMFLFYLLDDITQRMKNHSHGSTMIHVTKGDMEKLLIQLPPLPEQSKIASILSTVDDKIDSINKRIEETRKLKQGLMRRLLTQGIGHTKFKDSPLGRIPEGWEVVRLGDYQLLMTNGFVGTATEYYVDTGGVLYIQGYNVQENKFRFTGIKYVSKSFHKKHKKSQLMEGDLLTVQTGHIGTTVVVPKELEGSNCHALIITRLLKEEFNPKFVSFFLNSEIGKKGIKTIEVGSTLAHINVSDFMKFRIPKPSLLEQHQLADILTDFETKIDILHEKKSSYEQLKRGLMQQLLTGKIRVKLDN